MFLNQKIELIDNAGLQSYVISYEVINNDTNPHTIDVRLAFDTMNTDSGITAVKNQQPYKLENDDAEIPVTGQSNGQGTYNSAMGSINDLYDTWGDSNVHYGANAGTHTGAGFWWENQPIPANTTNPVSLGSVTYGPITLKKEPYLVTTTTTTEHKQMVTETTTTESKTILPQYLDIQSSDRAFDNIPIRLYDLSTKGLKENVGDGQSPVSAFHAANSLKYMDRVIDKISEIRSYYGAIQNRLTSTYNINANTKENVTASESRIRDTDMETELVKNSQWEILQQSAQAMMAQANQSKQSVLDLLSQ